MKILVSCRGNHDRSPLVMGLVAHHLRASGVEATVESCGILGMIEDADFFKTASKNSIAILAARGIDISDHQPRHVSRFDLKSYDLILVVTPEVKKALVHRGADPDKIRIINEAEGGLIDPHGKDMPAYEQCLATVEADLDRLIGDLIKK